MSERPSLREVTQRFLANDPTGIPGDCVRAAVASLLDREPTSVPHFIAGSDIDSRVWWYALKGWAADNGWAVTRTGLLPRQENVPLPKFGIACGPSERGVSHAVVAVDGQVVWDPHPSRAGILRTKEVIEFEPAHVASVHRFTWGQSVSADAQYIIVLLRQGKDWTGEMHVDPGDAVILADMLTDAAIHVVNASSNVTVIPPTRSEVASDD